MTRGLKDYAYLAIIIILGLVFFSKIFLNPSMMVHSQPSDFYAYTSFIEQFKADTFREFGTLPLWNNYALATISFIGDAATFPFYPLNLVYNLMPVDLAYGYFILIHVLLAGVFTYLFMRTINAPKFASFVAAITFMFYGKLMTSIYAGHTMFFQIAFFPLILLLIEKAIQKKSHVYAVLAGLAMAIQFLGMHPQLFFYSSYIAGIYALLRGLFAWKESRSFSEAARPLIFVAVSGVIMILLSAAQLFPGYEATKYATERNPEYAYEYYSSFSLPIQNTITFILPDFFGNPKDHTVWGAPNYWELSGFLGIIPLILALAALVLGRKNIYVIIFGIITLYTLLFSFGGYIPLFSKLHFALPLVSMFRASARMLFIFGFSVAALAGFGASFLVSANKTGNKKLIRNVFLAGVAISFVLMLLVPLISFQRESIEAYGRQMLEKRYGSHNEYSGRLDAYLNRLAGNLALFSLSLFAFFLIGLLRLNNALNQGAFQILLALAILIPLWSYGHNFVELRSPEEVYKITPAAEFLEHQEGLFRVVAFGNDTLPPPVANKHYIQIVDKTSQLMYDKFLNYLERSMPVKPNVMVRDLEIRDIKSYQLLDMLNVKYIVSHEPYAESERLAKIRELEDGSVVYENLKALPRAYVIYDYEQAENENNVLDLITKADFDPGAKAFVEGEIPKATSNSGIIPAEIGMYSPNKIIISVKTKSPGLLVVSEVWSKDWNAYDNDVPTRLYKTNYMFRGVYIDAGQHTITLKYESAAFRIGALISGISLIAVLIFLLLKFRKAGNSKLS